MHRGEVFINEIRLVTERNDGLHIISGLNDKIFIVPRRLDPWATLVTQCRMFIRTTRPFFLCIYFGIHPVCIDNTSSPSWPTQSYISQLDIEITQTRMEKGQHLIHVHAVQAAVVHLYISIAKQLNERNKRARLDLQSTFGRPFISSSLLLFCVIVI